MHEGYSHKHFHNDICIVHLDEWARGEGIATVRLPSRSQVKETFAGRTATVSGWGGISNAEAPINPELKYADVTIRDNQICSYIYPEAVADETRLCTYNPDGSGICHGDSGGPLTITESDTE
ncbi:Hypothetical predicted protein [Cloeon dipterum]|uniref:Peptidase S1 domain-containing protein n=1 Tax=Cloeon dipterum TaxID=197152 RepID=A0A8S1EC80_9INSE|nr:Hypothetical predicted protein [Cloeon dipterum]